MLKEPLVLDDFLDPRYADKIEEELLSYRFPWFFAKDIAEDGENNTPRGNFGFSHFLYGPEEESAYFKYLFPIVEQAFLKSGLTFSRLIKARSFLHTPVPQEIRDTHDGIHTDTLEPHMVCLYYVNDSEGDTLLFDRTAAELGKLSADVKEDKLRCIKRILPRKGRALLFDGSHYHCSTPPEKSLRCVINFDLN